jgi:hypothetical protein
MILGRRRSRVVGAARRSSGRSSTGWSRGADGGLLPGLLVSRSEQDVKLWRVVSRGGRGRLDGSEDDRVVRIRSLTDRMADGSLLGLLLVWSKPGVKRWRRLSHRGRWDLFEDDR